MSLTRLREVVMQKLSVAHIRGLGQRELMETIASVWGDIDLGSHLPDRQQLLWECLKAYGRRGYLTALEDQEVRRLLALAYRPALQTRAAGSDDAPANTGTTTSS